VELEVEEEVPLELLLELDSVSLVEFLVTETSIALLNGCG
tara:strand:- start:38 stop:157 length:120 start_codon:yes stop_codon:yes gene_type:complete